VTTLICGSSGYIGQMLSGELLKMGRSHFLLSRTPESKVEFQLIEVPVIRTAAKRTIAKGELKSLSSKIENLEISHLVNLAGVTKKTEDLLTARDLIASNVLFATELAIMCIESGIRNYLFSSTYSTSIGGRKYDPQTLYAATKKATEDILIFFANTDKFKLKILNLYDVYGPHSPHGKIINYLVKSLINEDRTQMSQGFQEISPIHIDDVTSALIASIENIQVENYCHFDLHGPEVMLVRDLPGKIESALNKSWKVDQLSFDLPTRTREILKFEPQYGLPNYWSPRIKLETGIQSFLN
jgi:nucleoside-diphosphate-sugar epimerase